MEMPASLAGEFHCTVARALPAIATTAVGAAGTGPATPPPDPPPDPPPVEVPPPDPPPVEAPPPDPPPVEVPPPDPPLPPPIDPPPLPPSLSVGGAEHETAASVSNTT